MYKDKWNPVTGKTQECKRKPTNTHDRYAVAVKKDETTVGHLPLRILRVCSLFLQKQNTILCTMTGKKTTLH